MYNYFCLGIITLGAIVVLWQGSLLRNKEIVYGSVIDTPAGSDGEGGTTYGIVASFSASGASYEYRSRWHSSSPGYSTGDRIKLYFDRTNPGDCGICSFGYRFGVAFILILIGSALITLKYGLIYGESVMDYLYPVTRG